MQEYCGKCPTGRMFAHVSFSGCRILKKSTIFHHIPQISAKKGNFGFKIHGMLWIMPEYCSMSNWYVTYTIYLLLAYIFHSLSAKSLKVPWYSTIFHKYPQNIRPSTFIWISILYYVWEYTILFVIYHAYLAKKINIIKYFGFLSMNKLMICSIAQRQENYKQNA